MNFEIKDLLYLMGLVGAMGATWATFRAKVEALEKSHKTIKNIVFKANGELALVTSENCREQKARLQRSLEKSDAAYMEIKRELNELSKNVLIIMIHLNIDVDQVKKSKGVGNG